LHPEGGKCRTSFQSSAPLLRFLPYLPAIPRASAEMCVDTPLSFCYSICFAYCADGSIRGFIRPQPGRLQEKSKGDMTTSNDYARFGNIPVTCTAGLSSRLRACVNRWRFPLPILLALCCVCLIAGCGGGGGSTIILEVQPNLSQMMDEGGKQVFTAFVAPDPNNLGVTWTLTGSNCAGNGCGTLSATKGSPITYTAPTGLGAALTVMLEAMATEKTSVTQTISITVVLPPQFALTPLPPNGANGVPYNFQIVVTGGVTPLTYKLNSGNLPEGLTLNSTGSIVGRPTGPGPGPNPALFTVQVTDNVLSPTPVVSQQFSISVSPAPPLSITSSGSLSPATLNIPYSTRINTSGGVKPFRWTIPANTLPPGLVLDPVAGVISGTPTQAGTFHFTPTVQDSTLPNGQIASTPSPLSITVSPPPPLVITTPSPNLPGGMTLTSYNAAIAVTGGVAPYTWSVSQGQLPSGLTLNPNTGQITGTPILVNTSDFTIQVTDSETNPVQTVSKPFSIIVGIGAPNPNSLLKGSYTFLFKGSDAQGPVLISGSFLANGNGSITSGTEDMDRISGVTTSATLVGSYALGNDGRGSMTLTATNSLLVKLTTAYQLVFDSDGNAHFFENDSSNLTPPPIPTRGEGIIKQQSGTNFANGNFSGNYAFAFTGRDHDGTPSALVGFLHADGSQTFSPGLVDFNDEGAFNPSNQLSGNFGVTNAAGRGNAQFIFAVPGSPQLTLQYVFYFVSPTDLFFVSSPPTTNPNQPLLAGEMILQDPSIQFNQAALAGPSIATGTGLDTANASAFVGRLLTADPACVGPSSISFVFNQNDGGVNSAPAPLCGTYSVDPDGRASFTNLNSRVAAAYLYGRNQAFLIGSDKPATVGLIEPQTGAPFTLSPSGGSIQGGYTLSASATAEMNVKNLLGQLSSLSGDGTMSGTVDEIDADGTPHSIASAGLTFTLTDPARGRGIVATNTALLPANLAFYIVSPSKIRLLSTDNTDQHPQVIFLDH